MYPQLAVRRNSFKRLMELPIDEEGDEKGGCLSCVFKTVCWFEALQFERGIFLDVETESLPISFLKFGLNGAFDRRGINARLSKKRTLV